VGFVEVASTGGQRRCFMYCRAWGEEKFDDSRGLCWVSHQILFFQFLHVSQTTDCKSGPRSTNTFHLRTEMSVLVPGYACLKGSYSNHSLVTDAQRFFMGLLNNSLDVMGRYWDTRVFYTISNLYSLVIVMLLIPLHLSYQFPYQ